MIKKLILSTTAALLLASACIAATSEVQFFPIEKVRGEGPLPYNYRIIDGTIHVGGHPLNPRTKFGNTDQQVSEILAYLASKGVKTIIDLENSLWIQGRYNRLLRDAGFKRIQIPMGYTKVPTEKEWSQIKEAMKEPVYIHCKWGADRSGAVIARYLVEEKGYSPKEAWRAVITGGSHAGPFGGLKQDFDYSPLVFFFWPNAVDDEDFKNAYFKE